MAEYAPIIIACCSPTDLGTSELLVCSELERAVLHWRDPHLCALHCFGGCPTLVCHLHVGTLPPTIAPCRVVAIPCRIMPPIFASFDAHLPVPPHGHAVLNIYATLPMQAFESFLAPMSQGSGGGAYSWGRQGAGL